MGNKIFGQQFGLTVSCDYSFDDTRFYKAAGMDNPSQVGVIQFEDMKDEPTKDALTILREIVSNERDLIPLTNACYVQPTSEKVFSYSITGSVTVHEKVAELQEPDISKARQEIINFNLWKNMAHITITDEALMQKQTRDRYQRSINKAGKELAKRKNKQIAAALLSGTQTGAGSDWSDHDNDPFEDINTAIDTIEDADWTCDIMVANRRVWSAMLNNKNVKGQLNGGQILPPGTSSFTTGALTGINCIVDNRIKVATAILADKDNYVTLAQGPFTIESYRGSLAGFDAFLVRDWMQPQVVVNEAGYLLTGLLS